MSERPTLTIAVVCPTCGGTGETVLWVTMVPGMKATKSCPDCTDGTIRQAVSCGGCAKWTPTHDNKGKCRHFGEHTWVGFGCLAWEAKA